jgi:hypothetical protein
VCLEYGGGSSLRSRNLAMTGTECPLKVAGVETSRHPFLPVAIACRTAEKITSGMLRGQIGAYFEDCSRRLLDRACRRPARKPRARVEPDDGRFVWRLSRCSPTRSMRYTTLPLAPSSWARASFRRIACTAPGVRRIALAISLAVRPSRFRSRNRLTSVSLHDFLTLCIACLPAVRFVVSL